jgi:hypothetical protein
MVSEELPDVKPFPTLMLRRVDSGFNVITVFRLFVALAASLGVSGCISISTESNPSASLASPVSCESVVRFGHESLAGFNVVLRRGEVKLDQDTTASIRIVGPRVRLGRESNGHYDALANMDLLLNRQALTARRHIRAMCTGC